MWDVRSGKIWLLIFFFWLCHVACGILVPRPGIEPMASAVEVPHLNHWAAREAPWSLILRNLQKVNPRIGSSISHKQRASVKRGYLTYLCGTDQRVSRWGRKLGQQNVAVECRGWSRVTKWRRHVDRWLLTTWWTLLSGPQPPAPASPESLSNARFPGNHPRRSDLIGIK